MKAELTEEEKLKARIQVQYEYSQLTGEDHINSQGEPDIDYVEYLENLVADRGNYARIQIEKDREEFKILIKKHLQTHVSGYTPCCDKVFDNRPVILD
jgi:hypothetical protein